MFKRKYRIVTDNYSGYEVQYTFRWLPFWIQAHIKPGFTTNTWTSVEEAENFIKFLETN